MLLSQLETSNVRLFSYAKLVYSVIVRLTGDCEQGQAYDMGLGFFLLVFSVGMLLFIGVYALSILLAGIFFLMGVLGVVAGSRIKPRVNPTGPFAQKVLVEVKCKSCNTLNPETSQFCATCGARL